MNVGEMQPTDARSHLGRFLFTGDDAFRPVKHLSGGEKNKLVLAQLTFLRPNLLILDEPTNHLDLDSREALGQMLREYDGTLLLVSHDRYLLDQVTNRTLEVADGHAQLYDLGYGEYRAQKTKGILKAGGTGQYGKSDGKNGSNGNGNGNGKNGSNPALETLLSQKPEQTIAVPAGLNAHQMSKERQRARNQVGAAERKVETLEDRLRQIETSLSNPQPTDNVMALSQEHGGVQLALNEAMYGWEQSVAYAEVLDQK